MTEIPTPEQIEKMYPFIGPENERNSCKQLQRDAYTAALELVKEREEEIIRLRGVIEFLKQQPPALY